MIAPFHGFAVDYFALMFVCIVSTDDSVFCLLFICMYNIVELELEIFAFYCSFHTFLFTVDLKASFEPLLNHFFVYLYIYSSFLCYSKKKYGKRTRYSTYYKEASAEKATKNFHFQRYFLIFVFS